MINKKSKGGAIIRVLLATAGMAVIFSLSLSLNKVMGSDESIFVNNQNFLFGKVTYLFSSPRIGDIVLFRYDNGSFGDVDNIGVIIKMENSSEGEIVYSIANRLKPKYIFRVNKEQIVARAIYPQTRLEYDTVNKILINLQGNKGGQK